MSVESGPNQAFRHDIPEDEDPILNFRLSEDDFEQVVVAHAEKARALAEQLEDARVELTPAQQAIKSLSERGIVDALQRYGIVLPENAQREMDVLPLRAKDYRKIETDSGLSLPGRQNKPESEGMYLPNENKVIVWYKASKWQDDGRNQEVLLTLTHELNHAKSYRSLQAFREAASQPPEVDVRRSGLVVAELGSAARGKFGELDEALVETLAVEVTNDVINSNRDLFRDAILKQIEWELKRATRVKGTGNPRVTELQAKMKEAGFDPMADSSSEQAQAFKETLAREHRYEYPAKFQSYSKERRMLERLIKALTKKSQAHAGKEREVRALFYAAVFNGNLLPIGRLIEKTFGKGTFRLLAENPLSKELEERLK